MNPSPGRIRTALRSRGAAAFLVAALLVGLGTALLVAVIELVRGGADVAQEIRSGWAGFGRWAALALLPIGLMASHLISRGWGPGVGSGGVTGTMVGLSLRGGYVATRTYERVIVPHGDTVLETGDMITAFGTSDARVEFAHLVEPMTEKKVPAP